MTDANDQTLLAICIRYPLLDAEGNIRVIALLFKHMTALIEIFQIKLFCIKLQFYNIKILDVEKYLLNDIFW